MYVDNIFLGAWNKETAPEDPGMPRSHMGYIITYANCPVIWASKVQSTFALSTTESEYYALSAALCKVIEIMNFLREIKDQGIADANSGPEVHCKCFEDNLGTLELARLPKMQPHTKHINLVWHHFWDYIRRKLIHVIAIKSEDQPADIIPKSVEQNSFVRHCCGIGGHLSIESVGQLMDDKLSIEKQLFS
eukprot:800706-Ditylum_brightwellii.AAC.1